MDVNGTRFHLLFGESDWAPLVRPPGQPPHPDLDWDATRASLSLRRLLFRFPTPPSARRPQPENRRGAGRDRYGNWYWIADDATEIRFLASERTAAEHYWAAADLALACRPAPADGAFGPLETLPPRALPLSGLAVTEHHYLVVGVLEPAGLLVFDLHAGGPPTALLWPRGVPFAPFDLAPAPGGGVWVLDRAGRYWGLDRYFRVIGAAAAGAVGSPVPGDFQPAGVAGATAPSRECVAPAAVTLDLAWPLGTRHPLAIEALPDGSVLVLDEAPDQPQASIARYRFGELLAVCPLDGLVDSPSGPAGLGPLAVRGYDLAFVGAAAPEPERVVGTIFVVDADGNQAFAYHLEAGARDLSLTLLPRYLPLRRFTGKALVAAGATAYYDQGERWRPLVEQPQPRYRIEGVLETPVFDGKQPDCVWHRLFLDACIPPGTRVRIDGRVADQPALLARLAWQEQPGPYLRADGPELPYYRPFPPEQARAAGTGTWELLFQELRGRYLQLRLTLVGTGGSTPRLWALRAYYPRFSYLREYLPAVYGEDGVSASFLDRFLANLEGFYTVIEGQIEQAQYLLDTRTTAAEYLDWLASWLGVMLDPSWDEARRRLFLAHAVEMFTQRGTLRGLLRAIRLAIDPCPDATLFANAPVDEGGGTAGGPSVAHYPVRIVERFLTRSVPGVVYGDPTDVVGPGQVTPGAGWTPAQGSEPLHAGFRAYVRARYSALAGGAGALEALNAAWGTSYSAFEQVRFAPVVPAGPPARAADWQAYARTGLGFTYAAVAPSDAAAYQTFLARRYRQVARLNEAYQLTGTSRAWTSFAAVRLPDEDDLPSGGRRLYDWIQFVSLVLPLARSAHAFDVLVPVDPDQDRAAQEQRLSLVRRIVDLEKPAHTSFEVRQYWALFRVGEARLGLDTRLDVGSRFMALALGRGYLAESYLAPPHPWDVADRIVVGRDELGSPLEL